MRLRTPDRPLMWLRGQDCRRLRLQFCPSGSFVLLPIFFELLPAQHSFLRGGRMQKLLLQ